MAQLSTGTSSAHAPCVLVRPASSADVVELPDTPEALRSLLEQRFAAASLSRVALERVAARMGASPERVARSAPEWSRDERERLRAQVVVDDATALAWGLVVGSCGADAELTKYCRAAQGLLGKLPAVSVRVPAGSVREGSLATVARLAEAVPGWSWTIEDADGGVRRWLFDAPDSHTKAVLRSGLAAEGSVLAVPKVDPLTEGIRPADPSSGGPADSEAGQATESITAARSALDHVIDRRTGQPRVAPNDPAVERARSLAELALFRVLESMPETRGLFVLNEVMSFRFGRRPAEVDLFAERLALCVEVDGPHHFVDADAYRRDRRKDALLQRHGFWVVRALAEDVVNRIDDVKKHILTTVRARRAERRGR